MKKINRRKTLKFIDILNDWIEQKNDIKIQSKQKYENINNNYLKLSLGNMPITKLSKQDIISFFANLNNKNISLSIKKTCYYIINSSLNYAYNENYCNYFNLKDIKLKSSNKTIFVFSKEQQLIIENELKNNMNIRKICLLLCLYTGLRIGEICGLKWEDINFNKNYIEVKRTIERIKNINGNNTKTILIESTPKSITSNRIIPIPTFLIEYLNNFKDDNNYFLLSKSDKLYDPRYFETFYERLIKKIGINYVNFHTLRHTFATRSIESKMDIKTLSELLGHSSVEITLKLYVHPSYELKKTSIDNLVNFMINS